MKRFYTGKGDKGKTWLAGKIVSKNDLIFDCLGGLDELNSWLGVCRAEANKSRYKINKVVEEILLEIQEGLFVAQTELAFISDSKKGKYKIVAYKIEQLEKMADKINKNLPTLSKFIIPGGALLASQLHYGRTLARRVERHANQLANKEKISGDLLRYLNRLSSVLFILARFVNFKQGIRERHPLYL